MVLGKLPVPGRPTILMTCSRCRWGGLDIFTIQDKCRKCLTEEKEILSRSTEYCSELYKCESRGDNAVLDCSQLPDETNPP